MLDRFTGGQGLIAQALKSILSFCQAQTEGQAGWGVFPDYHIPGERQDVLTCRAAVGLSPTLTFFFLIFFYQPESFLGNPRWGDV